MFFVGGNSLEAGKSQTDETARKKRVRLYKKIIITLIIILLMIPTILCIILFFKVNNLENRINDLMKNQNKAKASVEANVQSVKPDDTQYKKVYLTFDDGPSENTETILKILDEYHVKATFFVIGKTDEKSTQRYKEIAAAGHTIGLHSYSHDYKKVYASVESFADEYDKLRKYVYDLTGVDSRLIRFPGGSSTTASSLPMQDYIDYANSAGYTYFDWNVSSGDGTDNVDVQQIIDNVISNVGNFSEPVILMHDANNKITTIEALPYIISYLIQNGYMPSPIDETVKPVHHVD